MYRASPMSSRLAQSVSSTPKPSAVSLIFPAMKASIPLTASGPALQATRHSSIKARPGTSIFFCCILSNVLAAAMGLLFCMKPLAINDKPRAVIELVASISAMSLPTFISSPAAAKPPMRASRERGSNSTESFSRATAASSSARMGLPAWVSSSITPAIAAERCSEIGACCSRCKVISVTILSGARLKRACVTLRSASKGRTPLMFFSLSQDLTTASMLPAAASARKVFKAIRRRFTDAANGPPLYFLKAFRTLSGTMPIRTTILMIAKPTANHKQSMVTVWAHEYMSLGISLEGPTNDMKAKAESINDVMSALERKERMVPVWKRVPLQALLAIGEHEGFRA
mmetsp:Transcript_26369/g.66373  ORF Transcript_26369/g.66373 Transcript_26369/m.66373 type:complete len:343 (+) Transcript_26369:980-2008(+)